jgi:hypothetical protein
MVNMIIRRSFEKVVDSAYYSESELCGGAVTVSFSKYLPWQAMHFLQRSTHFSKKVLQTVCRKLQENSGTGAVLGLPLRGSSFPFISPSLKRFHHLKTAARIIASFP